MHKRRFFAAALALLLALPCVSTAESAAAQLTGYNAQTRTYQYVAFGRYPTAKDGELQSVLWRVLGPGVPDETDVINAGNASDFDEEKYASGDAFTEDTQDVFCLMTEYIIDVLLYHPQKDENGGAPLDYADSMIRETLGGEVLPALFTAQEQSVLLDMPQRGLLSAPSRKGELFREDYGFVAEDFVDFKRRSTTGTPYAFARGLKRISGNSWYFTTDWRRYGYRWIVADNGHISVAGADRVGGVRPVCYVHADRLTITGGDGTKENPYLLEVQGSPSQP